LIERILNTDYVERAGIEDFEHIRDSLRNLMKYLPHRKVRYDTDFSDDILDIQWNESELENDELKNYKAKAEYYIRQHQDNIVIAKLRTNQPLTHLDVESLEEILWKEVGTKEDYEKECGDTPIGRFVRKIVGVDRAAVNEAFSKFLSDEKLNINQIRFVNLIVDYIVTNGNIEDNSVFMKEPFKSVGSMPILFKDNMSTAREILDIVELIKDNSEKVAL
jgi:type I restriction enzyme R subunit